MAMDYILDSGPLGLLAHERIVRRQPIEQWVLQVLRGGSQVYIPEVADYEVRRELTRLIRAGQLPASRLVRLDQLKRICLYLPVSTSMWNRAAEFWADARLNGFPGANPASLDADVLIAAQADSIQATVLTVNPSHFSRWVPVLPWP